MTFGMPSVFAANYMEEDSPEADKAGVNIGNIPSLCRRLSLSDKFHAYGKRDRHLGNELLCPGV